MGLVGALGRGEAVLKEFPCVSLFHLFLGHKVSILQGYGYPVLMLPQRC